MVERSAPAPLIASNCHAATASPLLLCGCMSCCFLASKCCCTVLVIFRGVAILSVTNWAKGTSRSEERRVGKEWRDGGAREHYEKKNISKTVKDGQKHVC